MRKLKEGFEKKYNNGSVLLRKIVASALMFALLMSSSNMLAFADELNGVEQKSIPVPKPAKVQVIYAVRYLDKDTKEEIHYPQKKISFSNETETENAISIEGYKLASEEEKTITLSESGDNEIIFYYVKEELVTDELSILKESTTQNIKDLKNIKSQDKKSLVSRIFEAKTEDEVNQIYEEARNLDVSNKIQVKYNVRYLDIKTGRELNSSYTNIGFAYDKVVEKAFKIRGYELVSSETKSLILDVDNSQTLVFYYKKIDLTEDKQNALEKLKSFGFIDQDQREALIDRINGAYTKEEITEILKDAERINRKNRKQVKYEVKHVDMETGKVLYSYIMIDFQGTIIEEKAEEFEGYGLVSPKNQKIILDPNKDNTIVFNYKTFDDPNIPMKEFLRKKLDYKLPLVYKNTDFTGNPDALRDYLIRKIHNGDLYAKFTATKEDQEKAYWDLFNKSTYAGNVRFARGWTDPDNVKDRTTPVEFSIGFRYDDTREDMITAENMMYDFVQKNITDDMSDLEKVQTIHDYIIQKAEFAVTEDNRSLHSLPSGRPTNSLVALMIEGKAVCEGYAMAFNRMAELAGVETIFVTGRYTPEWYFNAYRINIDEFNSKYDEIVNTPVFDKRINHAWNLVKIEGKWYHLDTYHDDFFSTDNPNMKQEHVRFLKSDKFYTYNAGRYWNKKYTPKAEENYNGNFTLIKDFVQ